MQKLMKNWVVSLVVFVLLTALAVFLFLDGFDVGGWHIADRMIHLITGLALAVYVVFLLFPLVARYKGVLRAFVLGEIAVLLFTALVYIFTEWIAVPIVSDMEVCAVLGLALWLRAAVEILHAYFSGAEGEKRVPLWRLLLWILLAAVGVWQVANPTISEKSFVFVIAIAAGVMAVTFGVLTISNYRASAPARAAKKQARALAAKAAEGELPPATEAPAALPAQSEEE